MIIKGNDIYMRRGDTEAILVVVRDEFGVKVPLVLGDKIYLTLKTLATMQEKILQIIVTEFVNGEALISIEPLDTDLLDVGNYVYDIQLTRTNGDVKTIIPPLATDELPKFFIKSEVTYE